MVNDKTQGNDDFYATVGKFYPVGYISVEITISLHLWLCSTLWIIQLINTKNQSKGIRWCANLPFPHYRLPYHPSLLLTKDVQPLRTTIRWFRVPLCISPTFYSDFKSCSSRKGVNDCRPDVVEGFLIPSMIRLSSVLTNLRMSQMSTKRRETLVYANHSWTTGQITHKSLCDHIVLPQDRNGRLRWPLGIVRMWPCK